MISVEYLRYDIFYSVVAPGIFYSVVAPKFWRYNLVLNEVHDFSV